MKLRKVLSLLVALAMMLEVLPLSLFANDMESVAEYTVSESVTVDASSLADNDELLEGYIEQLFGTGSNSGIMLAATYTGEDALDDVNLEVYTALKTAVANIASGAESSTVIAMTLTYDYSDFGVSTLEDAVTAFSAALDITSVVSYLLNDCPYELYWFDKTASVEIASSSISGSGTTMTVPLTVTMPVASAYQASGSTTTVDSSKVTAAQTAASYAQSLVSTYSGYSDEEKLEAFKEAICSLVSYETDYASADFGDIWQLVYVFDQDTSTNVVCEGYSKAFQYLCDLAGLESIIVTGTMSGGTGAGEHMWNVVYLDGVNYLVDVTNSDTGSVGQDGGLFMVCADDADASDETGYTFTVNNQTVSYVYDSTTLDLYPGDYLTLGTTGDQNEEDGDGEDESTAHSVTVSIGTGCEDYLSATVDKTEAYEGETVTISVSTDSNHPEIYLQILTPYYNTEYGGTVYISSSYTDNGDGTYSFTMPDDYVMITVYAGSYYITYGDDWSWSYGSIYWNCHYWDEETNIYVSKTGVYDEGDVIYLTVSILPEYSTVYEASEAIVTDENGNIIEATLSGTGAYSWLDSNGDLIGEGIYYTFEFTMPASDVTVSAKLEEFSDDDTEHTITVYADDGVTYDVVGTATAGEEVTITFAPDDSSKTIEMSINRVLSRDSEGNTISWNVFIDKTYEGSATYSYTFAMSVCDLEIYLYAGQYTITSSTNIAYAGYVNVSDSLADEGDTVKVTVYNYQGYSFSDLSVVDEEGNAVSLTLKGSYEGDVTYSDGTGGIITHNIYEFTMPASDVTITAIFEEALDYNVKISDTENCKVVSGMSTANEGNTVTLTVTPDTGYVVSTVTVEDADGNEITVTEASDGTYTFKMPASDVTVTVTVDIGSHTHTLTHVAAKDATCTEDGNTEYWYCDDCGKYFSDEDAENEITLDDTVVEATGHDYGCDAATFTLSVSAYSLMGYPQSGDTLDITLPYSLSASDDVVLPVSYTLTVNGVTVSLKGSDGTGSGTYTQTVDIGYAAMNYSDSANAMIPQSSTAVSGDIVITATVDCSAYGSDCTIDVSDIGSWDFCLGYVEAGATTGAGVNADGMTITKTYESTNVSWSWSDDYSTATATFTCKNDSSHTETADATVTSETTKEATCTATGSAVYTAVVDMDGTSYSDTKTVELPMIPHTEGEAVTENEVAATCTEDGSYESVVYCSVCGEELSRETVTVDATGHNYVATETTATCTEGGYTTYVCSECGDTYTDEETEALGHDYESVVTKEPTCTETGIMTYTCSRCGDSYTEDIEMIDHTYSEPEWTWIWSETEQTYNVTAKFTCTVCGGTDTETALIISETSASTCIEQGSIVYTATVDMDGTPYSDTKTTSLPLANHTEGEAVTENEIAATCTTDGSYDTVVYCTVCNEELSRETITVPATGHTEGEAVTENEVAATRTTDGSYDTVVYCSVCGEELSRETVTVPATGHTEGEAVTENEIAATCTTDGSYDTVVYCTVCNEELSRETIVVPATGHTEGEAVTEKEVAATCTTDGSYDTVIYCSVCGEELSRETVTVPATGHTTEIQNAKDATCTEDGYTGDEVCTVCGETITVGAVIPATGHSFDNEGVCEACGAKTGEDGTASTVTVESDDTIFANVLPSGLVTSVTISISNDNSGTLVVSTVVEVSAYPYLVEHIADTLSFTLYNEAQGDDLISETNSFTITTTENNKKTLKKVTILFYGDVDYSGTGTSTVTMDFASASDLSSSDIYVLHYAGTYPQWEVVTSTVTFGETITVEFEASDYSPFVVLSVASASSGGSSSMIDILLRISANYSDVTEAIDRANALNPSDYENFSAVTEAINAVNWNLKAINQLTVNAYADAINTAIDNLVKTTATITEETVNIDEPIEGTNTDTEDDIF